MNFRITSDSVGADDRGWVQLHVSTGGVVKNGDQKFEVTPDDIKAYAAYIQANPDRIPIDYDHAFDKRGDSRAAGWIDATTVEIRNGDELWAQVDWTPTAAQAIKDGEYRYISPEFSFKTRKDGVLRQAAEFLAATLTNRPFLKNMAAVSLSEAAPTNDPNEGDPMSKVLATSLGLAEDADEATILAAITERDEKVTAAEKAATDAKTDLDAAKAELETLKQTASEGDKAVAKLTEQVATLAKEAHESKRDVILAEAIKGAKMLPAEREAMVELYDAAGHDKVVALLEARPAVKLNEGQGSGGEGPASGDAGMVGDTPVDPETADLDAKVQAHIRSLKLDRAPTQDDYLRAVQAVQGA